MPAKGYFIDANLLLLLVVGSVSLGAIARHRRLREFTWDDYGILINLIGQVERVLVTPNTLTETSNLLGLHGEPERSRFFERLRFIIEQVEEIVITRFSRVPAFHELSLRAKRGNLVAGETAAEFSEIATSLRSSR